MGLNTALSGFVVVLLSLSVVQGQTGWSVTYTSTQICAVKGSTVNISCTYTYPEKYGKVKQSFWFVKERNKVQTDLKTDPDYRGRVEYLHHQKTSTLRISDLRESDSAVYKFRFITSKLGGKYTGPPGVTLTVTGLQVQVIKSVMNSGQRTQLKCLSCQRDHHSYVWYRNGNPVLSVTSAFLTPVYSTGSYSCGLKGYETFSSPSVYSPRLPSVSVSPSGEIVENSSVTLTCSSDANPEANYTWSKRNGDKRLSTNSKLFFSSIQTFDSGEYQCTAVNDLGIRSEYKQIDVKYSPRLPSVSVSPSAEVVEGSSVTLTCSSDANPEANYTWYKENEDSPKASGQIFNITDSRPEHSGNYSCEAQNIRGRHKSTFHLTVLAGHGKYIAAGVTAVILLILLFLYVSVFLWTRRKSDKSEENVDNKQQTLPDQGQPEEDNLQYASIVIYNKEPDSLYSNIRETRPHRKMEEQEVTEYAAITFNTIPIYQETGEDPFELYSRVNKT